MSTEDWAVALEQLRGEFNGHLQGLTGKVATLQTSVQLGMQSLREQLAGMGAALGHQDSDCNTCRQGIDRQWLDHETRIRVLEAAKWKLIGALLIAGPLWGAICGALATKLFKG